MNKKSGMEAREVSITIHDPENDKEWHGSSSGQKPKIQRVPEMNREIESDVRCYEPLVVAIGPFHRGESRLQPMEMCKEALADAFAHQKIIQPQNIKLLQLRSFLSPKIIQQPPSAVLPRFLPNSASADELYRKVLDILPDVKKCYPEGSIKSYSDEEFARMMFVDGCFILQYIYCLVTDNNKPLGMKSHTIAFVRRDLFLLENQLPFQVLQVLMSCMFKKDEGMKMITTFITSLHAKPPQNHGYIKNFFGKICKGKGHPSNTNQESSGKYDPVHLLELKRTLLIDPAAFSTGGSFLRGEWYSYRSAMELRRTGIHFRPGKSHKRRLSDVEFKSFYWSGFLTLPPIAIDDSTKSELLNLVAYEALPDTPDDFGVTSYLCFMDSLIDHAEDVKELRSQGILLNFLGSDQEVASLFNEIARYLVPNPHAYISVKNKIEDHYKNKGKIWVAEWKHTHFNTPWTILAFLAAIFVIVLQVAGTALSGIQVYYAIHPNNPKP